MSVMLLLQSSWGVSGGLALRRGIAYQLPVAGLAKHQGLPSTSVQPGTRIEVALSRQLAQTDVPYSTAVQSMPAHAVQTAITQPSKSPCKLACMGPYGTQLTPCLLNRLGVFETLRAG